MSVARWLILLLLLLGCGGAPTQRVIDEGPPPPDLTARPYGLTQTFLEHLRAEKYAEAYGMLSPSLQQEITIMNFRDSCTRWRRAYPRAIGSYAVRREKVAGGRAQTQFGPPEAAATDATAVWTLNMVQEQGTWRISGITGPAFPP